MGEIIEETKAMQIVHEFLDELKKEDEKNILALYVIGSLGGGYYRPGQSDIDTAVIIRDEAKISQKQIEEIADKYYKKYDIPKGFGAEVIRISELSPPYTNREGEDFFTMAVARLKLQSKLIYGTIDLNSIKMPTTEDFKIDALKGEKWLNDEFGYPVFDKLQITGCVNCILGNLRGYLIIEKNIFEFNKFLTIETYLSNNPPIIDEKAFTFIKKKLNDEVAGDENDLAMLRECGIRFREFFNKKLLNVDTRML